MNGKINLKTLETTKCIVSSFKIKPFEFDKLEKISLFRGYKTAIKKHLEHKFIIDLCILIL